jgi:hypothetical protein
LSDLAPVSRVNRARPSNAILTVLALAALALGGCGGSSSSSSGVSPKTYVKSICTSLGSWSAGIKTAGAKLQATATGTTSLAKGKSQYQIFVAALVTDTGRAVGELRAAGVPAVKDGKRISDALVGAFQKAQAGLSQAAAQAAGIPTTNASSYQAAATGVTATIRQALAQMATVRPEKDPQLHAAAAKEPSCQALKTG